MTGENREYESFTKSGSREWGEIKRQAGRGTGEEFASRAKGKVKTSSEAQGSGAR